MLVSLTWYAIFSLVFYAKSLQSCVILCNPLDNSPSGSSVLRILQSGILEWIAMPSFGNCLCKFRQTRDLWGSGEPKWRSQYHFFIFEDCQVLYKWLPWEARWGGNFYGNFAFLKFIQSTYWAHTYMSGTVLGFYSTSVDNRQNSWNLTRRTVPCVFTVYLLLYGLSWSLYSLNRVRPYLTPCTAMLCTRK